MSRILVVEDEANVRKLVTVNLISRGYTVIEAENIRQALEQIRAQPIDLLVLDIKLPDATGWDLLTKIQTDDSLELPCPVVVMTASVMDAYVDRSQYPMVTEVLVKPFSVVKLMGTIKRALHVSVDQDHREV